MTRRQFRAVLHKLVVVLAVLLAAACIASWSYALFGNLPHADSLAFFIAGCALAGVIIGAAPVLIWHRCFDTKLPTKRIRVVR